jgi:hypothetical protein
MAEPTALSPQDAELAESEPPPALCSRLESDTATVLAWLAANASAWAENDADEKALLRHLGHRS